MTAPFMVIWATAVPLPAGKHCGLGTSTAVSAYVSGALGKLAYCGNLAAAKTAKGEVEVETAGHSEVAATESTDMTRYPVMFGGTARLTDGGTSG